MARTGRPRQSDEALKAKGQGAYVRHRSKRPSKSRSREPESPPRRPLPGTAIEWRRLLLTVPEYDPFCQAEGFHFESSMAASAIDWIEEHCRHIKGARGGQLLRLEDWQRAIIANLFGWVDEEGVRRYRWLFLYVPRKNAKTTLAAAIGLYVLFEDDEPGAELYAAAGKEKQARIVWKIAGSMAMRDPYMRSRLDHGKPYVNSITLDDGESWWQVIASDGRTEHGGNTHCALIDELHAQGNPDLMEAIRTSTGGRRQPLIILMTTADVIGESVCNDELDTALTVIANAGRKDRPGYNPRYLPVIYRAGLDEDHTSPAVWRRVNPLFETSPELRRAIEEDLQLAKDQPSTLNSFKRLHLNIQTESAVAYFDMGAWDQCDKPFDPSILVGRKCYAGGDLGETGDLTAFVLYFPEGGYVLSWFWVPEVAVIRRDKRNDTIYRQWAASGHLTMTEGDVLDYRLVEAKVAEITSLYRVQEIGLDLYNSRQLVQQWQALGHKCFEVRTGALSMNEPMRRMLDDTKLGRFRFGGNPVLRWCAANTKVKRDVHDNICPVKPHSSSKIDGIVALAIAYGRAILSPEPEPDSVDALYLDGEPLYL